MADQADWAGSRGGGREAGIVGQLEQLFRAQRAFQDRELAIGLQAGDT